ncbi:MAG TPA: MmcQ/YjbR family DNA-binding protein [Myxococcales bacterium]
MTVAEARKKLLKSALAYPDAWTDHPWGETVVKVGKKIFVFLGLADGTLHVTCKLPHSFDAALSTFSFAEATGYGLGASGWVTARFEGKQKVPVPLLIDWVGESYRAVAPAKLVKQLPEHPAGERRSPGRARASPRPARSARSR